MSTKVLSDIDSNFRFVLVAAERAEQLMQGAKAQVEAKGKKFSRIAMEEVQKGLIDWDYGPEPVPEETVTVAPDEEAEGEEEEVH